MSIRGTRKVRSGNKTICSAAGCCKSKNVGMCTGPFNLEAVVGGIVSATFQKKLVMFLLTNKEN